MKMLIAVFSPSKLKTMPDFMGKGKKNDLHFWHLHRLSHHTSLQFSLAGYDNESLTYTDCINMTKLLRLQNVFSMPLKRPFLS